MAIIQRFPIVNHFRANTGTHVLHYVNGKLKNHGRAASFWFKPLNASLATIPIDDKNLSFIFRGRSKDFQELSVQGVITYRIYEPQLLAERVDFSIDLAKGNYLGEPLEELSLLITQLSQQFALDYLNRINLKDTLTEGIENIRQHILQSLKAEKSLSDMGIEIVSVRVSAVKPSSDVERALQMPTHEAIQQQADEATFSRRAQAVEKERAIAENELQNRIALAQQEEALIEQQGQNARQQAEELALAAKIEEESKAERLQISSSAKADSKRLSDEAYNIGVKAKMDIYENMSKESLMAVAFLRLAEDLNVEQLNITPDLLATFKDIGKSFQVKAVES